jgi:hypothetical protein
VWSSTNALHRITYFLRQMGDVETAHVAKLNAFQLLPEPFAGVQLGGIGGQALQVQALCRTPRQELLDDTAAMDRCPIPDEDQAAGHLAQQVLQKPDHVVRVDGVILAVEVELAAGGDGTDRRQMVAGVPLVDDRCLTYRGIGAHDAGQGIKARFIYEEGRLGLGLCPFLIATQVSMRQ